MAPARKRRPARGEAQAEIPQVTELPETKRHMELRTLLYGVLVSAFGDDVTIGSRQLVFWDRGGADQCLVPDIFVHMWEHEYLFREWDAWRRGIPQLAVEILDDGERGALWEQKLEKYRDLKVEELVCFDPDSKQRPIRIWNSIEGSRLFERRGDDVDGPSWSVPGTWVARHDPRLGLTLRLARAPEGRTLFPTDAERVRELEAELKARST